MGSLDFFCKIHRLAEKLWHALRLCMHGYSRLRASQISALRDEQRDGYFLKDRFVLKYKPKSVFIA